MLRRLVPILAGLVVVLLLTLFRIADPFPIQVMREIAFDFYQRLAPRPQAEFPVRVVDIDEASLAEIGQWPWPRDRLATLTDRLTELGAAAIGFDILFPEADRMSPSRIAATIPGVDATTLPDNDQIFAASLSRSPSILGFSRTPGGRPLTGGPRGGFAISGPDPTDGLPFLSGTAPPIPVLRDAAPGLAALSLNSELSATAVRRLPMLWTNGNAIFPTLSVEALRVAMGIGAVVVLGDTAATGYVEGLRIGDFNVPLTSEGDLWLYYSRPNDDLTISASDLLRPGYKRLGDRIAGNIVLVGTSASGLLDLHNTVLGDNVPGVTIHAQAIEQIIAGTYLSRPDWVGGLEIVGFLALGTLLVLIVLTLGPIAGLVAGGLCVGGAVAFSWWMFRTQGTMLDPSYPIVGLTLLYLALVFFRFLTTERAKRQIRRAFGYYVAPSLLAQIEKSNEKLKLGGDVRRITVLFSDMRGFTSLSERLEPRRILTILNTLFGALGHEIVGRMGTIDKFIGDAIMAFWNAPVDVPDHERKALRAALGMREKLAQLNATDAFHLRADRAPVEALGIGIGISTGEALVGNMGLETRFDYSALGDTVNVAARVESACKEVGYDILVSDAVRLVASDFALLEAGALALKGKAERVKIHLLVGDSELAKSGAFSLLRTTHNEVLEALRTGNDVRGGLAECLALSARVEPGLVKFYETLPSRRADFEATDTLPPEVAKVG
ncbi:adenylate/guanylate cyclase domain-containing protein [Devosia sp. ZB163]|uniref:CHASE2 domain-containing protein n=1 Tax=Devosia sp. ZB163 TaxID=3025938 RepID=UPI0023617C10|nr:adenylate/guanylate cyclase domain-containing protein [Devosia sp. ZB163]MDC9822326.1 adenylate/guanylate cyclase domain-containing protein [Devosia sp. ZB163]